MKEKTSGQRLCEKMIEYCREHNIPITRTGENKPDPNSIVEFHEMKMDGSRVYFETVKMPYSKYEKMMKKRSAEVHEYHVNLMRVMEEANKGTQKSKLFFDNYALQRA